MGDNDKFPVLSVVLSRIMQIGGVIVSPSRASPGTRLPTRVGGAPGGRGGKLKLFENWKVIKLREREKKKKSTVVIHSQAHLIIRIIGRVVKVFLRRWKFSNWIQTQIKTASVCFKECIKLFYFFIYFCVCHWVAVSTMIPEPKLPLSLQKLSLSLFPSPKNSGASETS